MGTVLVVEDDPDHRAMLRLRVQQMGHTVIEAASAVEAVQALTAHGVADVAVVDIVMPDITGLQLVQFWRGYPGYAWMPVILMTARTLRSDHEAAKQLGAQYLLKPIAATQLVAAINRALASTATNEIPPGTT